MRTVGPGSSPGSALGTSESAIAPPFATPAHATGQSPAAPPGQEGTAGSAARRRHRPFRIVVLAAFLVAAGVVFVARSVIFRRAYSSVCVYPRESIAALGQIDALTGHTYSCVMAFANAAPTWSTWEAPWFATTKVSDENWAAWVRQGGTRRLVITTSLVPSDVPSNWRQICASGGYNGYAEALGHNLVSEGLARSVLRISPEANDPASGVGWSGGDPGLMSEWAKCWADEAKAMEVPGSHFLFDWTVNAAYEDIPFSDYYPGNSVVNIIGIDAYDSVVNGQEIAPGRERWQLLSHEPGGIWDLVAFARAHGKPLSVPEWGEVAPPSGGGDDPYYVQQMARLFKKYHVAFESYFDENVGGTLRFDQEPQSLRMYQETVLHG